MALVNLKRTQEEVRPDLPAVSEMRNKEEYPYGLRITLNKDTLQKLDFPVNQVKIAQSLDLACKAQVVGIHSDVIPNEPEGMSVELQITDLDFSMPEPPSRFKSFHDQQTSGPGGEVTE